jgi:FKBP-type peptidyl-prolyl cis-trans isomerase 2
VEQKLIRAKIGDLVKVHFTCKFQDGTVFESSLEGDPLQFKIGEGQVISGLEEAVVGMNPDESKTIQIPSEKAYGPYKKELVKIIEQDQFPEGLQPTIGIKFKVHQRDGLTKVITVTDISGSNITLDANHPLAGKDPIFDIQLLEITSPKPADEISPSATVYYNLGVSLHEKGQLDKAIAFYKLAIEDSPKFADVCFSLGNVYLMKGQFDEAEKFYQRAVEINPDYAEAHWNVALLNLLLGNFEEGWKGFQWRWKLEDVPQRSFSRPLWDGSDISGRTILLHAEKGISDTIQFIRYAPLVAQRGAKVIVECQRELIILLKNVEGIWKIITHGEQLPEFDLYSPLLSLPLVFNTTLETIPEKIPYISVDPTIIQKWHERITLDISKLKIGLVWSGSSESEYDREHLCPLEMFSPLAQFDEIIFYNLVKGEAVEQAKNPPKGVKFVDYTEEIQDLSDCASLIENLDLVISVDSEVAHLAGALGKPVWTLLPFVPDWRWLLNREDSPWYPTMRLFRQPSSGDWEPVIASIIKELVEFRRNILERK